METVTSPVSTRRARLFLQLGEKRCGNRLTSGDQQRLLARPDLLLDDHAVRQRIDLALPHIADFGVRIQRHQGLEDSGLNSLFWQDRQCTASVRDSPLCISFS